MTYKLNPFTGKLDTSDGPQGPAGVVSAAGPGSQGTPSISFAADLDTGLYNYTLDGIAVSTGGTGRLFVDASGKVGVGTNSPSSGLHLSGAATADSRLTFTQTTAGLSGTVQQGSSGFEIAAGGAQSINFVTNGVERLRIASDGKLGLGTSSPDLALTVNGAVNLRNSTRAGAFEITSGGDLWMGTATTLGKIYFETGHSSTGLPSTGTARMTVTSTGVGIGTTSPVGIFTIQDASTDGEIILRSAGGTGVNNRARIKFGYQAGGSNYGGYFQINTTDGSNNNDAALFIDNQQRVGIGTTSPALKLHAEDSSSQIVRWTRTGFGAGSLDVDASGNAVLNAHTTSTGIAFHLQASEKARITSSGQLLVGTSSSLNIGSTSAGTLQVADTASTAIGSFTTWVNNPNGSLLVLGKSRSTTPGSYTIVANNDLIGALRFACDDGTDLQTRAAEIKAEVDGTPGANDMPGRLVFSTTAVSASSPTERMRIGSNGSIYLGSQATANTGSFVTTAHSKIFTQSATDSGTVGLEIYTNSTATRYLASFSNTNGVVGSINVTGSATAYTTSSDYRLKENVVPLTGAANRLNQLQVRRFNFIADPDTTVDGFLAHEAQAVVPECVTGTKDEVDADGNPVYQGIDQSKLVPLLTAALQEALAEIESLKARVTALEP